MHWLCIGAVFGGQATELAGRAIDPAYQARRLGSLMLQAYVADHEPEYVTTYTRNPAILRMISTVAFAMSPISYSKQLHGLSEQVPYAKMGKDGVFYHTGRYGADGLYGENDPADKPYFKDGLALKSMYRGLEDPGNALVVAARVNLPHARHSLKDSLSHTEITYNGGQDD